MIKKKSTHHLILEKANARLLQELEKKEKQLEISKKALLKIASVDFFDHKTSKELGGRHLWLWSKMQITAKRCLEELGFTIIE